MTGHARPRRACQYEGCGIGNLDHAMIELSPNEWYCPSHALLALGQELVTLVWLSRSRPETGAAAIVRLVSEKLPDIVVMITEHEGRTRWFRHSAT